MTAPPAERSFPVFSRGDLREELMASWRIHLRALVNPETNAAFTETEIATATADDSRWWAEADAIDLVLQTKQQQALFLADQVRIDRAGTSWLRGYHGDLWKQDPLPPSGGSGPANAPANVGTIFVGSTTVPDPAAHYVVDPAGLRYQVLFTTTATTNGISPGVNGAKLTLKGVDTGEQTNIDSGTKLKWVFGPLGVTADATASADFTGGTPAETDAEYARRLKSRVRHKPAAGNQAHFRAWARDSSNAVEDAFVYPCAQHAGSVLVCILQKRSTAQGPNGRIPSVGTLTAATIYLTPPASPVVPVPPHVVVLGAVPQSADSVLRLAMPKGLASGWTHINPWPGTTGSGIAATILTVTDQTHFRIAIPTGSPSLPAGVTAPPLMVWDPTISRFEALLVVSATFVSGLNYDIVLSQAPTRTLTVGDNISPDNGRRALIGLTIEQYFDSLGPGEVIDLVNDTRGHRAMRFPLPSEEYPQVAGTSIIGFLQDALGGGLANASVDFMSNPSPLVPTDPVDAPRLVVPGKVGIYAG